VEANTKDFAAEGPKALAFLRQELGQPAPTVAASK
jgi:hypothetical protein